MNKKTKQRILIGMIILVVIFDSFSSSIGAIPILGDIAAIGGNILWEVIELGLVFGLINTKK